MLLRVIHVIAIFVVSSLFINFAYELQKRLSESKLSSDYTYDRCVIIFIYFAYYGVLLDIYHLINCNVI